MSPAPTNGRPPGVPTTAPLSPEPTARDVLDAANRERGMSTPLPLFADLCRVVARLESRPAPDLAASDEPDCPGCAGHLAGLVDTICPSCEGVVRTALSDLATSDEVARLRFDRDAADSISRSVADLLASTELRAQEAESRCATLQAEVERLTSAWRDAESRAGWRTAAESRIASLTRSLDEARADLARLTAPGPATDDDTRATWDAAWEEGPNDEPATSAHDRARRIIYTLGLAQGRAEQERESARLRTYAEEARAEVERLRAAAAKLRGAGPTAVAAFDLPALTWLKTDEESGFTEFTDLGDIDKGGCSGTVNHEGEWNIGFSGQADDEATARATVERLHALLTGTALPTRERAAPTVPPDRVVVAVPRAAYAVSGCQEPREGNPAAADIGASSYNTPAAAVLVTLLDEAVARIDHLAHREELTPDEARDSLAELRRRLCDAANDTAGPLPARERAVVEAADADVLDPAKVSSTEVDAELRAAGGDPNAIGAHGTALVSGLLAKRRAIIDTTGPAPAVLAVPNEARAPWPPRKPADMSVAEMQAEIADLTARSKQTAGDDDEGHSGSPGEWMWERIGDLDAALKERGEPTEAPPPVGERAEVIAVGDFIYGHARRLAEQHGEAWDSLDGDGQSWWASQVHDVLNNLRASLDTYGDPVVVDGRRLSPPVPAPVGLTGEAVAWGVEVDGKVMEVYTDREGAERDAKESNTSPKNGGGRLGVFSAVPLYRALPAPEAGLVVNDAERLAEAYRTQMVALMTAGNATPHHLRIGPTMGDDLRAMEVEAMRRAIASLVGARPAPAREGEVVAWQVEIGGVCHGAIYRERPDADDLAASLARARAEGIPLKGDGPIAVVGLCRAPSPAPERP
jgi:hypothetical protein